MKDNKARQLTRARALSHDIDNKQGQFNEAEVSAKRVSLTNRLNSMDKKPFARLGRAADCKQIIENANEEGLNTEVLALIHK